MLKHTRENSGREETREAATRRRQRLRFGDFEIDLQSREVWKCGIAIRLQEKPFAILECLLTHAGEFVTRQELARFLWPDSHVNVNGSINTAINTLRHALCDSAHRPRYIETRWARGYRLIANVRMDDAPLAGRPNTLAEAYSGYRKGLYFQDRLTEESLRTSIAYFEAAIASNGSYAAAYAGLAETWCWYAVLGITPPALAQAKAQAAIATAFERDPYCAEAEAARARAVALFDRDWMEAERAYGRALEIHPNFATAHLGYAELLAFTGRPEAAVIAGRQARELDPVSLTLNARLAWVFFVCGDSRAALEQAWTTLALKPRFAPAQEALGIAYEAEGIYDAALIELQNACRCSGRRASSLAALAHAHASAGELKPAKERLRELGAADADGATGYSMAIASVLLEGPEGALRHLRRGLAQNDVSLPWAAVDPRLTPLRARPEFQELMEQLHLGPFSPAL